MDRTDGEEDEEDEAGTGDGVGDREGDILSLFVLEAGGGLDDGLDDTAGTTAPLRFSEAAVDDVGSMAPQETEEREQASK
jgi:hypothetical protein